eukprot:comp22409_c0_seq1/m.33514 comp22409_c0_seq1/g.33514  ORF comp22409_c0_seq1/g.33514 comp22409_c0_seq1/m.33514 type:complete len:879 (-) comp22409_c0_seq1:364-3000(-)
MSKGTQHYFFKRWQQLQQAGGEMSGTRSATNFDEEFKHMQKMSLAMEKSYTRIPKELEVYLQPDPTARVMRSVVRKAGYTSKDATLELSKHQLYKISEAMSEAGNGFGGETTLGAMYLRAAEAHKVLCAAWVQFEAEAQRKYLKPLALFGEDLKEIKANLAKIDKDRLYLDATKSRKEQARVDPKHYDPTVVRHLNEKASKLQAELEEKAGGIQVQMEQFFFELEDDQMLVLANFIAAEIEFHRLALDALTDVGEYINQMAQNPVISIIRTERPAPGNINVAAGGGAMGGGSVRAKATHDFDATSEDELSFRSGDVLTITNQDVGEGDWWEAMLDGEVGLIPATYVELIQDGLGVEMDRRNESKTTEPAPEVAARNRAEEERQRAEREQLERELAQLRQQAQQLMVDQEKKKAEAAASMASMSAAQFQQALAMAQRQMQSTQQTLTANQKAAQKPAFKPQPAGFEGAQEALLDKAQQSMEMMRSLVNASYGPLPDLQLAVTDAVMRLQELGVDTKAMAGTLLNGGDRDKLYDSVKAICQSLVGLLNAIGPVAGSKDQTTIKNSVSPASKTVARAIGGLLDTIEAVKSTQGQALKAAEQEAQKAENEEMAQLLAAAQAIARVAQDLAVLQTKNPQQYKVHQSMVSEAQQVTAAASKLVQAATECQKAIAGAYKSEASKGPKYHQDGTWSEGLVSAAKLVASGVEDLFAAANEVVKGGANIDVKKVDLMRAVAQSISGSTVQVVMAGAAKNPDKVLQARLQGAGGEVQASVDMLVRTLGTKQYGGTDTGLNVVGLSDTQRRKAEIEAQARVLAAERELEKAQKDLMALRKGRYSKSDVSIPSSSGAAPGPDMDDLPPPPPPPADDSGADDLMARLAALRK